MRVIGTSSHSLPLFLLSTHRKSETVYLVAKDVPAAAKKKDKATVDMAFFG